MAKFPKVLYVKWESGGSGPDYLSPYDNPMDTAEMGEKVKVGIYRLEGVQEIEGVIETRKIVPARRKRVASRKG